jgi:HEAT repeat protein
MKDEYQQAACGFAMISVLFLFAVGPECLCAQTNSKEIMGRQPAELVAILQNPKASVFEKAKACQRLASAGTKDAVPALAALLPDEKLNAYARFALEVIPDPSADAALRAAATRLHGPQLVGVLNSIGQRRDAKAIELLGKLVFDKDAAVASAAAGALGRIGTPEAAKTLFVVAAFNFPVPVWIAASDACLSCADRLSAAGNTELAVHLYMVVLTETDMKRPVKRELPKHLKVAALRGLFRLKGAGEKDLLLRQLHSPEKDFFNVALAVAREMPGAEVTAALAGELEKLPPDRQALLLLAIADRQDSAPIGLFLAASKSKSTAVREAALRALAKCGDARAVTALLDAALNDAEVAQVAGIGLKRLPGHEADAAICARLAGADAKDRIVLLDIIGARQIIAAKPAVRRAMTDADEPVRVAALAAMAQLINLEELHLLIDRALAQDGSPAEIAAAKAALLTASQRTGNRDLCAAKLAERLGGASAANQVYLLDVLGKVDGPTALAAVVGGAKSSDPAVKDAATRVLGEWFEADAAPALLDIAKNDPVRKYQIRALRGYIRLARQLETPWGATSSADAVKLAMFRAAMAVAQRDKEKQLALNILGRVASVETLELAVSYLQQPKLKDAAAEAAVQIAARLVDSHPKAVADAMREIIKAKVGGEASDDANELLNRVQARSK